MTPSNRQKLRFVVVGAANTAIDFILLFILKSLGLPVLTANAISSGTAFAFSFVANKKYTFKSTDRNIKREIILFVAVTLFGLWVLQSLVIALANPVVSTIVNNDDLSLICSKLLATIISMIWNYIMYSRVVFRRHNS